MYPHVSIFLSLAAGQIDEIEASHTGASEAFFLDDFRGFEYQGEHGVGTGRFAIHCCFSDVPIAETAVKDFTCCFGTIDLTDGRRGIEEQNTFMER